MKAKSILKDQKEHSCKYLDDNVHVNFSFIPLVLERNPVAKTPQCKIKSKNKKCKKLRPKKLRAYIPNEEQALSPVDLLKWQDKNILIIGKPGVGKTTVVQEMLRLWSEKDGREIDYMFYFDESVLAHSSNIASLQSILFDVYLKPMENDRMDVFKDIEENSENVVLILDGVTDFGKHSILWKIMNHELLPDAKIVITCRSEVEYDPLFRKWPTQKVYVQGFSKESINTYYHTMLGHDPVLLEVVLKNQELFSLSHVPLYASMIVDLMQFKNGTVCDHPHTVTEMYIHIFRAAVKKQIQQIDKYLKEIKDQVYYLMENAFNATMQKTLNVISCDETDISRAFLKMITIRDSPTSAMTYCAFLHNTMQEFFSALWLLGHPDEIEKVLQLCQTEEHKHMRHVLPFLCGLLSEHNIRLLKCLFPEDQIKKTSDWFIEKLLDTFLQPQSEESEDSEEFDLLFVSQCLYELQSPKACLMFLEKMDHQLEPEEDLDPHQCCALSYVIAQSRDKEVYLNLEDCTIADVGMNMMLSCSPNIRLNICKEPLEQATFFLEFFHKASQCCCSFFDQRYNYNHEPLNALLDLCSHVKNYETQTGRSFLPALQSVFQSAPDVWIIDLSRRKSSVLLEVLKLQTEKKPVELIGCSEEESEVMSFLQCLPYISQLRISHLSERVQKRLLLELFIKAAEIETQTGEQMLKLLTSGFIYSFFPYRWTFSTDWSDFLLIFYSHVKDYETQTGRSLLPALQSVFQSTPDVWIIDLSQRKSSVLLEVLKLQTEKKPVELRGCSEEESEVMSLLQCLPYISQLRFYLWNGISAAQFVLKLFIKAAEIERQTGEQMLKLLSSVCTYSSFPYERTYRIKQSDFLLDLCSHVKDYETQTGWIFLPALQKVFQSAPDVWIIDFSQRKSSVLLEVLKLRTENKPVELFECSEEESEMMSFLQCLPYISQLRFDYWNNSLAIQSVLILFIKAAEIERQTGEQMLKLLSSVCTYNSFPYEMTDIIKQSDFLLDLYSHVKNYETQTGRSFLPGLQSVFQSTPDVWSVDLSQRKISILLEVLKLQTEKKPVELRGCSEEEREVLSFLQCLPYISQLRFDHWNNNYAVQFVLKLLIKAAETETQTEEQMLKLLKTVCTYSSFPYQWSDRIKQSDFLLDLCSHVKDYETQTGRSLLPTLQSVFQLPDVWIIDLSQRKSSILLEVLKLQTEKKPVELIGCSEEESEVMSLLQCLPYISQLSCSELCLLTLVKVVQYRENPELVTLLLEVLGFSFSLEGHLPSKTCRSVGRVLPFSSDRLNLTLKPKAISLKGTRLLFRHIKNLHTLRLSGYMVVRIAQALRSMWVQTPVTVYELTLNLNMEQWSERKMSRVLSNLAIILRLWTVQCLNLTEYKMLSVSLSVLLCHQGPVILRLSKETLRKLVEFVCEAQEEELTQCFLQKVGGDLTSCSLSWEELHYFLQHKIPHITVDLRKSNIGCNVRKMLPFFNRIQFKRISSTFMLSVIREIYESGSVGFVSSLLSSVENYINLQSRELDSVHCAALRFTLQHCTAVSLNLQWTSIPEEELESILPLFTHVSHLSVDRLLLRKMMHCCSVSDIQQETAAVLLSILQHKLDFSCCSALDLTANTDSEPLHLTIEDCCVMSRVIQSAHSDTKTQLILQDCEINTAGIDQLFPVLHSVKLCCAKSLLLQFLAHVRPEEAKSLSQALGEELNLSQTQLNPQVCRGLKLILEYSEGLTELDLSQCCLTDDSLGLLLPNLHKVQNIDFSGNSITDFLAPKIYSIVTRNSNIKTVRLFNNKIELKELFRTDPRFEIW
uniref:NACHT domain-containing protein n=1 Tax=Cyprinus carpio TaxID=7962 RepID=A0A8C1UV44_CYPCA